MSEPTPVASLPMYDWPEVSDAVDRLWQEIRLRLDKAGLRAPSDLDRRPSYEEIWSAPGLVLSQTCGYPYVTSLRHKVALVGAPIYDAPGCAGPNYRSMLVVRRDDPVVSVADLRGRRAVINSRDSQSGYSAFRAIVAPFAGGGRFFRSVAVSGGHRASLRAVAEGRADAATIDSVCWAMAAWHEPAAYDHLRVLALSPVAPSLPFITAIRHGPETRALLLGAIGQAIAADAGYFRKHLLLVGVVSVADEAYDRIVEIERRAGQLGYADVV
ncbi:MAG: PhnD/SsuA/transferrin family substrate-binding protein [Hyphomicrobiaceae bacterium]